MQEDYMRMSSAPSDLDQYPKSKTELPSEREIASPASLETGREKRLKVK
jgi:hypothetical protein